MSQPPPPCEFWRVNAFTEVPFAGNPAGVVFDADRFSDGELLAIAREANTISETAFLGAPRQAGADLRIRYFTCTREVDLCGHATIAAVFALAWAGRLGGVAQSRRLTLETRCGPIPVEARFEGGALRWVSMSQPAPAFAAAVDPGAAAGILGLRDSALGRTCGPIACASTGIWACFVPLAGEAALAAIQVDREAIDRLAPPGVELGGVYPFVVGRSEAAGGARHLHTRGRFFCPPRFGIVEDPVTGTVSGALGAHLIRNGIMHSNDVLLAAQGIELGRPGVVRVTAGADGRMVVGGAAAAVFRGALVAGR